MSTLTSLLPTVSPTMVGMEGGGIITRDIPQIISTRAGFSTDVTSHAKHVAEVCEEELAKLQVEKEQLEAEINPAI